MSGRDKYVYGDYGLVHYEQSKDKPLPHDIQAPTATPPDDSYDQDGPIEPPRTEEPEPFVGPPSPQSNKPSISPSPRSQRDNWNEDPHFYRDNWNDSVVSPNKVLPPNHHGKPSSDGDWSGPRMKSWPWIPRQPSLNEEDTSYDVEGDEEVIMNDRSTEEDNPLSPEIKANAEKAWDYRKAGYAANKIKSSWNELNPLQKRQIKDLAKQKGRDWSEMDHLHLNEMTNHNIFLNHLNLFSK